MVKFLSAAFCALAATDLVSASVVVPQTQTVLAQVFAGWSYTNCGLPTDPVQVNSIEVVPDPPQPGKDLTVTVAAVAQELIEEGAWADVEVKLGLVRLLHKRFDLCEEARNNNVSVQCPIEKGSYILNQTVSLPREIPRAKFTIKIRGYTAEEDDMLCLDVMADFLPKRPMLGK